MCCAFFVNFTIIPSFFLKNQQFSHYISDYIYRFQTQILFLVTYYREYDSLVTHKNECISLLELNLETLQSEICRKYLYFHSTLRQIFWGIIYSNVYISYLQNCLLCISNSVANKGRHFTLLPYCSLYNCSHFYCGMGKRLYPMVSSLLFFFI